MLGIIQAKFLNFFIYSTQNFFGVVDCLPRRKMQFAYNQDTHCIFLTCFVRAAPPLEQINWLCCPIYLIKEKGIFALQQGSSCPEYIICNLAFYFCPFTNIFFQIFQYFNINFHLCPSCCPFLSYGCPLPPWGGCKVRNIYACPCKKSDPK